MLENTMTYKGYIARIEYDSEDRCFFGRVLGIRDVVGFDGQSVDELETAFHRIIDFYIESCCKSGVEPETPAVVQANVHHVARVHPGDLLTHEFLEPMGLDVDSFARHIGVESETVANVCNEKAPVTLEIALRLGRALKTTSQFWLNAQHAYDDSRELQRLQSTGKIEAVESVELLKG